MYPVNARLRQYLKLHGREVKLPVTYENLLNYTWAVPIKDKNGKDTLWEKNILRQPGLGLYPRRTCEDLCHPEN